jgi:hypothetical protein
MTQHKCMRRVCCSLARYTIDARQVNAGTIWVLLDWTGLHKSSAYSLARVHTHMHTRMHTHMHTKHKRTRTHRCPHHYIHSPNIHAPKMHTPNIHEDALLHAHTHTWLGGCLPVYARGTLRWALWVCGWVWRRGVTVWWWWFLRMRGGASTREGRPVCVCVRACVCVCARVCAHACVCVCVLCAFVSVGPKGRNTCACTYTWV